MVVVLCKVAMPGDDDESVVMMAVMVVMMVVLRKVAVPGDREGIIECTAGRVCCW